jgi:superfamily II DNA or RNA helicase
MSSPTTDATAAPVQLIWPDWREWVRNKAYAVAESAEDYELHMAAVEWSLASPLAINDRKDFESLAAIRVEPFDHQVSNAILFFRRLAPRGLIADDVGLGKTITAGLIAKELMQRGRVESMLVVCPKPLLEQWKGELREKFGIDAEAASGSAFRNLAQRPNWITTYNTATSKIDEIAARRFDLLILDEAHALRNLYGTQQPPRRAVAFQQLMKNESVRFAIALTATPIQNRLWDLYSQIEILRAPQPNPFGSPAQFSHRFIQDRQTARELKPGTEQAFRQLVSETTIRTRRGDTGLVFPDREVKDSMLLPHPEEAKFIEKALQTILKFDKLPQIAYALSLMSSPWALAESFEQRARDGKYSAEFRQELAQVARAGRAIRRSAKTDAVLDMVRASARDGRAARLIVFTMRIETLAHLRAVLSEAGFEDQIGIIQGGQARANQQAIDDFLEDPAKRPILLSTDTGAVGLNLQAGNIVVNYDLPWNPMIVEQRIGRVQRLGQSAAHVIVHNLVLKGTIEEKVVWRLMDKLKLFSQAIGEMEELLELCGYDDEEDQKRSLEQVIMGLIRKSTERKDVERDLEQMKASREEAEAKMREMRDATESALASIKPTDIGVRLEGLDRVEPRLPLRDLIVTCIRRSGDEAVETSDGRLLVEAPGRTEELVFEFGLSGTPGIGGPPRIAVAPGTRGFERFAGTMVEGSAHRVLEGRRCSLDEVEARLRDRIAPMNLILEGVRDVRRTQRAGVAVACRVSAQVATDKYEIIVEAGESEAADEIEPFLRGEQTLDPAGHPLEPLRGAALEEVRAGLVDLEPRLAEVTLEHTSVRKFAEFYRARFQEDIERLARHIVGAKGLQPGDDPEQIVREKSQSTRAIRTAYQSIQNRFLPRARIEPVGTRGILYESAEVEARLRNRNQTKSFAIRLEVIPLSGAIRTDLPLTDRAARKGDAWACAGGHLCHSAEFVSCSEEGCTEGSCEACQNSDASGARLAACGDCGELICSDHRKTCSACSRILCENHALVLSGGVGTSCANCSTTIDNGVRVLAGDVAVSAVSGRRGHRSAMRRSAVSGGYFFEDEGEQCEESGDLLPPADLGRCSVTGTRIRRDRLERDEVTGELVSASLLVASAMSGSKATREHFRSSPMSGRLALQAEFSSCPLCKRSVPADELSECPEIGLRMCAEHMERCEESGERVAPSGLGVCGATGKRVRRSLLARDEVSGAEVLSRLLVTCARTGARVVDDRIAPSSVSGQRILASELVSCEESGRFLLSEERITCAVTGKHVHPDLVFQCPETGLTLLRSAASRCKATGVEVAPSGLERCEVTGRSVRRSLLAVDEVTGLRVQAALLARCEITGRHTTEAQLARSAGSRRLVLRDLLVPCEESGARALPFELAVCDVSGARVLPRLLERCSVSQKNVSRGLLRTCERSGTRALPEYMGQCSQSGKEVLTSLLGHSQLTKKRGLAELLVSCEVTGDPVFAEELATSALSGKRFRADRAVRCGVCARPGDISEVQRCSVCSASACKRDAASSVCRLCARLLASEGTGTPSTELMSQLKSRYPWIRRVRVINGADSLRVDARPPRLAFGKHPMLLAFRSASTGRGPSSEPLVEIGSARITSELRGIGRRSWAALQKSGV